MDYESRNIKWYWLALFFIYCGWTGYLLFSSNPYLYSHVELRSVLSSGAGFEVSTMPSKPETLANVGSPTYHSRYNPQRTAVDPNSTPHSREFAEYQRFPIDLGIPDWDIQHVAQDTTGFYLTGKTEWVVGLGIDGKARWKFAFEDAPASRALYPALVDDVSVYVVHPDGELISLDKNTGELRWSRPLQTEVSAQPFIWRGHVMIPVKGLKSGIDLMMVRRSNGGLEAARPHLEIKPGFNLSFAENEELAIAVLDNKVTAIDTTKWEVAWSQTMTDPIKGPAVVSSNQIFVATLGAKVVKLDALKRGKVDWEVDLEKPPAGPPTYLPIMNKLSLLDSSGALIAIDSKLGKLLWRYGVENRNPLSETWSARLKGQNIEEFKMDWLHKGWSIWSPCSERRFCIYTPGKGQLISRTPMQGSPIALPLTANNRLVFLVQVKPGQYALSHVLEEAEIKKLKEEKVN